MSPAKTIYIVDVRDDTIYSIHPAVIDSFWAHSFIINNQNNIALISVRAHVFSPGNRVSGNKFTVFYK